MAKYELIRKKLQKIINDFDYFMVDILGIGEKNPMGVMIKEYSIKVPYTEFVEHKTEILKEMERLRLLLMQNIPSAYNLYGSVLPNIEYDISKITEEGNIAYPLNIKMDLELLLEKIKTAIEVGDVERLLSETHDFDKMSMKIYKDSLKKVAEKGEKALVVMDALLRYSSKQNPLGVMDLASKLNRNATWIKKAIKDIREQAPEIIRIVMVDKEYKYYIPDNYRRFYVE